MAHLFLNSSIYYVVHPLCPKTLCGVTAYQNGCINKKEYDENKIMISFDRFQTYAKKLLKDGTNICPCCLSKKITFTTDDEHNEFWLECKVCHVGVRNSQFSRTHRSWEHRPSNIPQLNEITHDIECEYWDETIYDTRTIT